MHTQTAHRPGNLRAADGYRGIVSLDGKLVAVTVGILPNRNAATHAAWMVLRQIRTGSLIV